MNFIQKVYYNDKPIVLTNDSHGYVAGNPEAAGFKIYDAFTPDNFADALTLLLNTDAPGALLPETSPDSLVKHLGGLFKIIQAGGGLVTNSEQKILMIFRRGKWDLPKGKLDKGETIDECALREVAEETGIGELVIGDKLCETWHLYNEKSKNLVKHTTWFKMSSTDTKKLVPQAEEDIHEVLWADPNHLHPYVSNTYKAIRDVLAHAGLKG